MTNHKLGEQKYNTEMVVIVSSTLFLRYTVIGVSPLYCDRCFRFCIYIYHHSFDRRQLAFLIIFLCFMLFFMSVGSRKTTYFRLCCSPHFHHNNSNQIQRPVYIYNLCLLSSAAPKARDGRYCNAPRPSVRLSVRLSRLVFTL